MKLLRRPIGASDRTPDRFCVISIEFLSLSRKHSTFRKTPLGGNERGEMSALHRLLQNVFVKKTNSKL